MEESSDLRTPMPWHRETARRKRLSPYFFVHDQPLPLSRDETGHIGDINHNGRWDEGEGLAASDYAGIQGPSRWGVIYGSSNQDNTAIIKEYII